MNPRSALRGAQINVKHGLLAVLLGTGAFLAPCLAIGAGISATYHPIAGGHWTVDFAVTGDGNPSVINDFTIYFPDTSFAALSLGASPAGWDSLIVQPDVALHSAGFLDSLALGSGIPTGASVGDFQVMFDYLGLGTPPALRFSVNDANFQPVFSGLTTVAAVPEPELVWLMVLGLSAIAGARVRKRKDIETEFVA